MKTLADDYKEWGDDYDGIRYDLGVMNNTTTLDEEWIWLIIDVLLKLPYKIGRQTLDNVVFWFASSNSYQMFNFREIINKKSLKPESELKKPVHIPGIYEYGENHWLVRGQRHIITLIPEEMKNEEEMDYAENTIAHEIAHYILAPKLGDDLTINAEREADNLIKKWGFKPVYTEEMYKHFDETAEFNKKQKEKSKEKIHGRENSRDKDLQENATAMRKESPSTRKQMLLL